MLGHEARQRYLPHTDEWIVYCTCGQWWAIGWSRFRLLGLHGEHEQFEADRARWRA